MGFPSERARHTKTRVARSAATGSGWFGPVGGEQLVTGVSGTEIEIGKPPQRGITAGLWLRVLRVFGRIQADQALEIAVVHRNTDPGLIHHSDRGT